MKKSESKKQTDFNLQIFATEWNRTHHVKFYLTLGEDDNHPTSIVVRFPTILYERSINTDSWISLSRFLESKSRGTLFIDTNYYMYINGIIEIMVSCASHHYRPVVIADTLRWLGEDFFPKIDIPI